MLVLIKLSHKMDVSSSTSLKYIQFEQRLFKDKLIYNIYYNLIY
jgi:hypothetical protein